MYLGIIFLLAITVIFLNRRNKECHLIRKIKIKIRQTGIFLSLSKFLNKKIVLQCLAGIFYFIL